MPAFLRAASHGYGIELDVQMTSDYELVVFHDSSLQRACGIDDKLYTKSFAELQDLRLFASDEQIPRFQDVLQAIDGRVPLLIEIKVGRGYLQTLKKTVRLLENYRGDYCIESFHPMVARWLKRHRPLIPRGLIACVFSAGESGQPPLIDFLSSKLAFLFLSDPDLVAYRYGDPRPSLFYYAKRHLQCLTAAWTIRDPDDFEKAKEEFDLVIFEGMLPDSAEKSVKEQ